MTALAGKVALVTGASRGIGLAAARALAGAGARVALLARDRAALAEAAGPLGAAALALPTDVSDPQAVRAAFAALAAAWGRLDVLVSNAALAAPRRVEEAGDAELQREVGTNLLGAIYCTREAVPALRASGGGSIVYVSSDAGVEPLPFLSVYAATKAGLEVFARAVREELRPDGIRVTLVRPGATLTGFARDWDPEAAAPAFRVWHERGFLRPAALLAPETVAQSILHAVTRPPGAEIRVLDLRPTSRA